MTERLIEFSEPQKVIMIMILLSQISADVKSLKITHIFGHKSFELAWTWIFLNIYFNNFFIETRFYGIFDHKCFLRSKLCNSSIFLWISIFFDKNCLVKFLSSENWLTGDQNQPRHAYLRPSSFNITSNIAFYLTSRL